MNEDMDRVEAESTLSNYKEDYHLLLGFGFNCVSDPPQISDGKPKSLDDVQREISELSDVLMEKDIEVVARGHKIKGRLQAILSDWDFQLEIQSVDGNPPKSNWIRIMRVLITTSEDCDIQENVRQFLEIHYKGEF